jgi:hypothetical protein
MEECLLISTKTNILQSRVWVGHVWELGPRSGALLVLCWNISKQANSEEEADDQNCNFRVA